MLDPVRPDPVLSDPGPAATASADPSVAVTAQRDRGRLRLCVRGPLDLATADHLQALLEPLVAGAPELVVVDLAGVPFIDVTGLRALLDVVRSPGSGGRRVVLAHPSAMLRRMVAVLHLEQDLLFEQTG